MNGLNIIIRLLNKAGALLKGHFVLSSGLHSAEYLQCALLLSQPRYAQKLCRLLAAKFKNRKIDIVVGPAYGGILVAYELARVLGARAFFAERKEGVMQLRRNFTIKRDERVLIAEDVITTGKSIKEVITALSPYNPKIIGIAALVDRSGINRPFGSIPFVSLAKFDIKTYQPERCPLCRENIPLIKPGSRPAE
jgi:orotate phosphoribosyltransferase